MRRSFLLTICVMGLLAASVNAQQYNGARTQAPVVYRDGFPIVAGAPYYTPGSSVPGYYTPAYTHAYFGRGFPPAGYTPRAEAQNLYAPQSSPAYNPYLSAGYLPMGTVQRGAAQNVYPPAYSPSYNPYLYWLPNYNPGAPISYGQ